MTESLKLNQLSSFVAVVEAGSFTQAAERSAQSKALISLHVKQLEAELGVALLQRSTRRLSLTEVGESFYQDCLQVLQATRQAIDNARQAQQTLRGTLRISASAGYGTCAVVPALARFAERYPEMAIEYISADRYSDLVAEGLDLAIRIGPGLLDSQYRARLIDRFHLVVVGAPHLLARFAAPQTPQDLLSFPWIGRQHALDEPLVFTHPQQGVLSIQPAARIRSNHFFSSLSFAESGAGLTALPPALVAPAIAAGRLQPLLPDYQLPAYEVFAVYSSTRHPPAKIRAFIDFLQEDLQRQREKGE